MNTDQLILEAVHAFRVARNKAEERKFTLDNMRDRGMTATPRDLERYEEDKLQVTKTWNRLISILDLVSKLESL